MPSKTKRLKVPELTVNLNALALVQEASQGEVLTDERLKELYGTKTPTDAKRLLMHDLILKNCEDPRNPPNTYRVKTKIINEYTAMTGCTQRTGYNIYNSVYKTVSRVANIGMLLNYGAAVVTDTIEKLYVDLENDDQVLNKPHLRLQYYKTLLDAAANLQEMGLKQTANDINIDKNKILEKKVDADTKLGVADVALRLEGLDRAEKEKAALDALFGDKTLLNPIFDQIAGEDIIEAEFRSDS